MTRNAIVNGTTYNPWHNLAVEELLFDTHTEGVLLYLWQNKHTVVIGRNQNAWKECRLNELEADGGRLARRTSGGGAVYHDDGNLNFTFLLKRGEYDLVRQLGVIISAVKSLGINARFSGRNDIIIDTGEKFSGNAFRFSRDVGMHHGTILINADMAKLAEYLAPPKEKLISKGVDSVRSRVCNLCDFLPTLTVEDVRGAVSKAFIEEYGPADIIDGQTAFSRDAARLAQIEARQASWEWGIGESPKCDLELNTRFEWGSLEVALALENGYVKWARVYSDAMDEAFIRRIAPAIEGVRFSYYELAQTIAKIGGDMAGDISTWILAVRI